MPVRPQLEYRLVWRRRSDKAEKRKIFGQPAALYRFLQRVGTQTPWKGATKRTLRGASYALTMTGVPWTTAREMPIRNVLLALTRSHKDILYLRVEMRQVLEWTMVGDPLKVLRPKSQDKWEAKVEAFCDSLDADTSQRWIPRTHLQCDGCGRQQSVGPESELRVGSQCPVAECRYNHDGHLRLVPPPKVVVVKS